MFQTSPLMLYFRRLMSLILITLVFDAGLLQADPVEEKPTVREEVNMLIESLASPQRAVRVRSLQKLAAMGPRILPFLPAPDLLPNRFSQETVRKLRLQLEEQKAKESLQASRVTLQKTASLQDILQEVTRQTENQFETKALSVNQLESKLTLDVKAESFWGVMETLMHETNLQFGTNGNGHRLVLLPAESSADFKETPTENHSEKRTQKHTQNRTTIVGPFRLVVESIRWKPLPNNTTEKLCRIQFILWTEPRLRPLFLSYLGRNFSASSKGASFPPFSPDAHPELPLSHQSQAVRITQHFRVPFHLTPESLDLKGLFQLQMAADYEEIRFPVLSKSEHVARRRGGVTVLLTKVSISPEKSQRTEIEKARQHGQVEINVTYDVGGPAFESHRTWIFHNDVFLETRGGERVALNGGFETVLQADGGLMVRYKFRNLDLDPDTTRFVYVAPTLLIKTPIEFRFAKMEL